MENAFVAKILDVLVLNECEIQEMERELLNFSIETNYVLVQKKILYYMKF